MPWINADGLYIKYGQEEAAIARGGQDANADGNYLHEFIIDWRDSLSATAQILGDVAANDIVGSYGVMLPRGLFVEEVETIVESAFTSSGTIASATLVLGGIRDDRTTAFAANGLFTTAATAAILGMATAGSKVVTRVGSTGAGAWIGTVLANDALIQVANSAHASHPFTAGRLRVRVKGYFPNP